MFLRDLSEYSLQGLRVFVYVASMGSVAEAAAALGLTQPAVSLQIHNLEKHIGFPLFERQGRKNVLTVQGQDLFQKLLPQLEGLEQILRDAREAENVKRPKIFIGSVEGIGEYWLGQQFVEFSKKSEDTRLVCELADTEKLEEDLLKGRVSMIITPRKLEHPRVVSHVLIDEKFTPVGRKKNIKALQDALEGASKEPRFWEKIAWIGYGDVMSAESWAVKWLESQNILVDRRLKYKHLVNSYAMVKQLVNDGQGVCIAPMHTCQAELEAGSLVALESKKYPPLRNRLFLCHREGSLNHTHQEFKDFLLGNAQKA
jgi:DNA-binding transcriptional LysR family regulator